jgi:drug/metabolite transporter (DMT)-like permease
VKLVRATALAGILYMLMAGLFFSILDTTAKYVIASVTLVMMLSIRFLVQALVSTLVLLPLHGRALLRIRQPRLQLLRGALLAGSTVMAVSGLKLMPVGEFTAIVMVTPMLVTVLAVTVLKQRIAPVQWLFVICGLAGTLMIIKPGGQSLGWRFAAIGLFAIEFFGSAADQSSRTARQRRKHPFVQRLVLCGLGRDRVAHRLAGLGFFESVGPDAADGLHGCGRSFRTNAGLPARAYRGVDALHVWPHWLCRAGWLAGV